MSIAGGVGIALLSLLAFKRSPAGVVSAAVAVQVRSSRLCACVLVCGWVRGHIALLSLQP